MSPNKQEQKTPTEDELDEFERRKNVPTSAPMPSPQYMSLLPRPRASWSALSGVFIVVILFGGAIVSYVSMRSFSDKPPNAIPMSSEAPSASMNEPSAAASALINAVTIRDILQHPTQYTGTEVLVRAIAKKRVSPNSFLVRDGDSELLILDVNDEWRSTSGRELYLRGEVRDAREIPPNARGDYKGTIVLYVDGIIEIDSPTP